LFTEILVDTEGQHLKKKVQS